MGGTPRAWAEAYQLPRIKGLAAEHTKVCTNTGSWTAGADGVLRCACGAAW